MIRVTKLDGTTILLNAEWIQSVERAPDTIITLTTGFKLIVREAAEEIANRFKQYKREIGLAPLAREDS